ncbi:CCA tRNA nucleotidyltransferase [Paracoccus spongiarum]|uniref:CCA tRNA nucleotidyltransferase n=1 Tax=Paracoccus spongiarum TaxID=3064387 RepID=A0ABT9JEU6_9RHOB|nr:CCA tRNA nucleotidyltransferase [Paracoccus sp. 2205BS29-5]MDP5308332.1 CCA tRNA nucleotidyltransferase [Paracoccus sp. 2205BS29-5]
MTGLPADLLRDPGLVAVLDAIEAGGHRGYLVGGAVRNGLLGQPVDDMDIATDADPATVTRLAGRAGLAAVPTGIDHGTVTLIADGRGFEVTTFRRDLRTDGRRAIVAFSDDLAEDARRRDFTMNALYADRAGRIIDPMGGLPDLRAGRLRFVGAAPDRIREDYLRILRFFRFFAHYGREADPQAIAACAALKDGLAQIARERVGHEMRKLLSAPAPLAAILLMRGTGVLDLLLPGATPGRLASLESLGGGAGWQARLAALSQDDLARPLRLSRQEARDHRSLVTALRQGWSFERIAYRLEPRLARAAALLVQTRDDGAAAPRPGWEAVRQRASGQRLPLTAADLQPDLTGAALGRGLKVAEDAWIESGFALPAATLARIARSAGKDTP